MRISLIITVLNEAETIQPLLRAIKQQTPQADEVIIVDGGSSDQSVQLIKVFAQQNPQLNIRYFIKKGNRSVGRNFAIQKSKNEWIAITDAGCVPRKNWLAELRKCVASSPTDSIEVVAGYYHGAATSKFQTAVIPYVLVMPNRINPTSFLPATRSMMIKKEVWRQTGGFNERLSHNEDYDLAIRIKRAGFKIVFCQPAIVDWLPVKNLPQFAKMIYRFALGDIEAGILRPKVILIFARYLILLFISYFLTLISYFYLVGFLVSVIILYATWSIVKNYQYSKHGWYWLPILQVTADLAVVFGSIRGMIKRYE